jgi:hypothetical protein
LMLTFFWDSQRHILETYLEHGTAVTSATYCDMLQRGLKPAVHSERKGDCQRASCCCLQCPYTYCGPHIGNPREIEHPAHSPNLVPSDFHLAMCGTKDFLRVMMVDGIKKLVGHSEKCVEKLYILFL